MTSFKDLIDRAKPSLDSPPPSSWRSSAPCCHTTCGKASTSAATRRPGNHILYRSGWQPPACHFSHGSAEWTDRECLSLGGGLWYMHIPRNIQHREVEFVMCDASRSQWDHPPSHTGMPNYPVWTEGVYMLSDGSLKSLRSDVGWDYVDLLFIRDKVAREAAEAHVLYFTGWTPPRIHFRHTNSCWTEPPGIVCNAFSGRVWHAQMPFHSGLEFVLNDGSGS
ncbi:unnamed protein product [Vitrella brassicaformis CCMP3155]|uniref:Uncharacterized protein n=1 Tax=Vitrella brassicaformis (strain CCMP3155) TaxID=1169540 RepID=A0A0G4FDH8_VITBC|nr:unnamed protein product [Vitrella brassicaformis CCMP3155]|eukprot:CEM10956.1 unnamed protein product [Vitrella brassicaformis CCMP3155]